MYLDTSALAQIYVNEPECANLESALVGRRDRDEAYENVTVRGLPIRRVRAVRALGSGTPLGFTTRCAILDQLLNADPLGEVTIAVPQELVDSYATVIAVDVAPAA